MSKYHVNSKGEPGLCRATKQCPFGGAEAHFPSPAEAQAAYEQKMKAHAVRTHSAVRKQSLVVAPKLSNIMDTELLKRMVEERFVNTSVHPDDPALKVLTYSTQTQITGRWNDVTKQARGLIIRGEAPDFSDAVVIERPWRKFFTLAQIKSEDGTPGWALGDEEEGATGSANNEFDKLDFHAPAEVTDKMDGSLGILYRAPNGQLAFSTKGSFQSEQALAYSKLLQETPRFQEAAEKLKTLHPNTTFLYELTGRDNQIVLTYEEDNVTLLGAVNKETGVYYSTADYKDVWSEEAGLQTAEVMPAKNLEEALALPDRPNREGVVVRTISEKPEGQMQIKIKQEDYLRLHRLLSSVSKRGARDTLRESNASVGDIIKLAKSGDVTELPDVNTALTFFKEGGTPLHQRLYEEQKGNFEEAVLPKARQVAEAYERVQAMPAERFQGDKGSIMKSFAEEAKREEKYTQGHLFSFFRARLNGEDPLKRTAKSILASMASDF